MIDQTTPRFKAAMEEVLAPFGLSYTPPFKAFDASPITLKSLLNAIQNQQKNEVMALGNGAVFDMARKLVNCGDQAVELTEKEAVLLKTLCEANGEVPRETLLKTVWGYAENVDTHTLETHIHRLRAKLKTLPGEPEYITTTTSGYKIA